MRAVERAVRPSDFREMIGFLLLSSAPVVVVRGDWR